MLIGGGTCHQEQVAQHGHDAIGAFLQAMQVGGTHNHIEAKLKDAFLTAGKLADQSIHILLGHLRLRIFQPPSPQIDPPRGLVGILASQQLAQHGGIVLGMQVEHDVGDIIVQEQGSQPARGDFPWKAGDRQSTRIFTLKTDGVARHFHTGRSEQIGQVWQIGLQEERRILRCRGCSCPSTKGGDHACQVQGHLQHVPVLLRCLTRVGWPTLAKA